MRSGWFCLQLLFIFHLGVYNHHDWTGSRERCAPQRAPAQNAGEDPTPTGAGRKAPIECDFGQSGGGAREASLPFCASSAVSACYRPTRGSHGDSQVLEVQGLQTTVQVERGVLLLLWRTLAADAGSSVPPGSNMGADTAAVAWTGRMGVPETTDTTFAEATPREVATVWRQGPEGQAPNGAGQRTDEESPAGGGAGEVAGAAFLGGCACRTEGSSPHKECPSRAASGGEPRQPNGSSRTSSRLSHRNSSRRSCNVGQARCLSTRPRSRGS